MLSDVLGKLSSEEDRQKALDLDPKGASSLPPTPGNQDPSGLDA